MVEVASPRANKAGYRVTARDPEPEPMNRKQGVQAIFQAVAFGVAFVSPPDAAAIVYHSENISQAAADCAANDKRFGKLLDRILEVGPYGALLSAIAPLAMQIAANHKFIKPGMAGTLEPDEMLAAVGAVESEGSANDNGQRPTPVAPSN